MTTPPGCAWTAVSSAPWIAVLEGAAGTGSGVVRLQTQANSGTARTGTVNVGGATLTVDQGAGPSTPACTYSLVPASRSVGAPAEEVNVDVRVATGCAWSASSRAGWITVRSGDSGTGNGSSDSSSPPIQVNRPAPALWSSRAPPSPSSKPARRPAATPSGRRTTTPVEARTT